MYTVIITRKKDGAEVRRFENVESHDMYSLSHSIVMKIAGESVRYQLGTSTNATFTEEERK
jgi:hypothetical protein